MRSVASYLRKFVPETVSALLLLVLFYLVWPMMPADLALSFALKLVIALSVYSLLMLAMHQGKYLRVLL